MFKLLEGVTSGLRHLPQSLSTSLENTRALVLSEGSLTPKYTDSQTLILQPDGERQIPEQSSVTKPSSPALLLLRGLGDELGDAQLYCYSSGSYGICRDIKCRGPLGLDLTNLIYGIKTSNEMKPGHPTQLLKAGSTYALFSLGNSRL